MLLLWSFYSCHSLTAATYLLLYYVDTPSCQAAHLILYTRQPLQNRHAQTDSIQTVHHRFSYQLPHSYAAEIVRGHGQALNVSSKCFKPRVIFSTCVLPRARNNHKRPALPNLLVHTVSNQSLVSRSDHLVSEAQKERILRPSNSSPLNHTRDHHSSPRPATKANQR